MFYQTRTLRNIKKINQKTKKIKKKRLMLFCWTQNYYI